MDVTELSWWLATEVQTQVVAEPMSSVGAVTCTFGGKTVIERPKPSLLVINQNDCGFAKSLRLSGRLEVEDAKRQPSQSGVAWEGAVRFIDYRYAYAESTSFERDTTAVIAGGGFVSNSLYFSPGMPLTLEVASLTSQRKPDAVGLNARLTSSALRVLRLPDSNASVGSMVKLDSFGIEGCVVLTTADANAELCFDTGSQMALLKNDETGLATGRIRWSPSSAKGFEGKFRISPSGQSALRVELDLDGDGSYEASASLDRTVDVGLRL